MAAAFRFLHRLFRRVEDAAVVVILAAMIVLACLQVAMRFFDSGLPWADALLRYLVLWGGMLGAAAATREGRHITIDLVSRFLRPAGRRWLGVLVDGFSAAVCFFLLYAAVVYVKNEAEFGGAQTSLGLAYWQLNLIFPAAFAVIAARFALSALISAWGKAE